MIQAMECLAKPQKGLLYGTSIPNIYIHIHRNNITAINGNNAVNGYAIAHKGSRNGKESHYQN